MSYVATLNEADIEFGRRLWQSLRTNPKFPVAGAFWLLEPEASDWRLIIATPRVDALGRAMLTENLRRSRGAFRQTSSRS